MDTNIVNSRIFSAILLLAGILCFGFGAEAAVLAKSDVQEQCTKECCFNYSQLRQQLCDISDDSEFVGEWNKLSADQKQGVWLNKIDETLKLNWTPEEYKYLQELRSEVSSKNFFEENNPDSEKQNKWIDDWKNNVKKDLGWSDTQIYEVVGTLQPVASK